MSINTSLLAKICTTPGAPGFEQKIRELVIQEVTPLVDELEVDNMGNVYAIKRGTGDKKVMIGAHMDEIAFMVTHIDDNGFIRFHTLGGFDPKTLTAQRVIVHGKKDIIGVMASKPIHVMSADERNKVAKLSDYFIDTGLTAEEVKELVTIGEPVTREREFIEMGNCVNGKSLDNRLAVFILIETFKQLQPTWTTSRSEEPLRTSFHRFANAIRSSSEREWLSPVLPPMKTVLTDWLSIQAACFSTASRASSPWEFSGVWTAATRP